MFLLEKIQQNQLQFKSGQQRSNTCLSNFLFAQPVEMGMTSSTAVGNFQY